MTNCGSTKDPRLTDVEYWDRRPKSRSSKMRPSRYLEPYLKNALPANPDWTCLEVGVVPGRMLLWMAKRFGYRVVGVDLSERVFDLQPAFGDQGVDAEFVQADFLDWTPNRQFDVVLSSGFVEHFRNYEEVIHKHWDLVRPGGYLVLSIPAWSPVQRILRRVMYEKHLYQNIVASHHTEMMNLATLRQAVELCSGGTVTIARYIAEMSIGFRAKHKGVRTWLAPLMIPFRAAELLFRILRLSHRSFSPGVLIVKQKDAQALPVPAPLDLRVSARQRLSDRRSTRLAGTSGEDK